MPYGPIKTLSQRKPLGANLLLDVISPPYISDHPSLSSIPIAASPCPGYRPGHQVSQKNNKIQETLANNILVHILGKI